MSYARFGEDSDVYVYGSGDNVFTCCGCKLDPDGPWTHGGRAILLHLEDHIKAGHKVPSWCIEELREELSE